MDLVLGLVLPQLSRGEPCGNAAPTRAWTGLRDIVVILLVILLSLSSRDVP